jgi:hypothetical protein
MRSLPALCVLAYLLAWAPLAGAQSTLQGPILHVSPAAGTITVDGNLSDPGWQGAIPISQWYEVNPGTGEKPPVTTVGYVTYDRQFLYIGLELADPDPADIRAPLGDHDHLDSNNNDFGGVVIDALDSGRTAVEFFVNAHNVQYDAVTDDGSGESSSPDFFWDSATRITETGWTLEMRIPFSTLRYRNANPQTWGIFLWRNYPHHFRYQMATTPIPHDSNCFVCHENRLIGLAGLPRGGHLVVAPYVNAADTATARDDTAGEPLAPGIVSPRAGLDVKFTPNAGNAIDATIEPDFSQIESDTAQISANERFALFYPEKRPFFLEGVDLLNTPIQAVYTRTITSPQWGGRLTGKAAGTRYTALATEDEGGGSVIIPGSNGSSTAPQDFRSTVILTRAKRDIGLSSVGGLFVDREGGAAGGHNRVFGPDLEWRPSGGDVISAQWLFAETVTPNRPDLAVEWTGRSMSGNAARAYWNHNTTHLDWYGSYADVTDGFRAETGFIPQVGYREAEASSGWTVRPKGPISRERTFLNVDYQADQSGALLTRRLAPGFGFDTLMSGFVQFQYIDEQDRAGDRVLGRRQLAYYAQFSPTRVIKSVSVEGTWGQDVDFIDARPASGSTVDFSATFQPSDHLEVSAIEDVRQLDLRQPLPAGRHLLTQQISRLRTNYTFTSRLFIRLIGQYVTTTQDAALYTSEVSAHAGTFNGSALLAYKINWQSVMFVGYGDDRALSTRDRIDPLDRQVFFKLSYAFQR